MLIRTTFVIQEHRAKKSGLHWDFRIKKDKKLASWVIPKHKMPESGQNLLAVRTSDHPLDWAEFEGDITDGYGQGNVKIIDKGDCNIYKWGNISIVFELKGSKIRGRFALVHIGQKKNWLILRSK